MTKVAGAKNPVDILTKYTGFRELKDQLMRVSVEVVLRGLLDRASGDKDDDSAVGGRAAGKPCVVSWADALGEVQQAREMNFDDG